MSTPRELDDPFPSTGEPPVRPLPPRTWRDRLDDLVAGVSPLRMVGGLAVVAVAAVVGWRMLAPPATPPEVSIPFTEPATTAAGDGGGADDAPGSAPGSTVGSTAAGATQGAEASAADGAGEVVVHVVGAVVAPGVQRLPAGSRVVDAVEAAGGTAPDADLGRVNLAAPLADGQQVYVLRVGEVPPTPPPAAATGEGTVGGAAPASLINVNTASASELEELPGVGPTTAQAIIDHRERSGPFASVDDLLDVRGIGEAKLAEIRDRATV
jgi:competence protein ComEA